MGTCFKYGSKRYTDRDYAACHHNSNIKTGHADWYMDFVDKAPTWNIGKWTQKDLYRCLRAATLPSDGPSNVDRVYFANHAPSGIWKIKHHILHGQSRYLDSLDTKALL